MEMLVELLGFIFFEVVLSAIGWVCLYVWYRNREKMEKVRDEKYAGEYSSAGMVMLLNLVAGAGAITMFGIVVFFLGAWIYKAIVS